MAPSSDALARKPTRAAARLAAWLLCLSLLPMLTFSGHWTVELPVPGTNVRLMLPFAGGAHHSPAAHSNHEEHCHEDAASCSNRPLSPTGSVAALREGLAFLAAGGLLWPMLLAAWRPSRTAAGLTEPAPP